MDLKGSGAAVRMAGERSRESEKSERQSRLPLRAGVVCAALLLLVFLPTIAQLFVFAAHSELNSHIVLVPFVTAWLLRIQRPPSPEYKPSLTGAAVLGSAGATALIVAMSSRTAMSANDALSLRTLAFVCLVAAAGFLFLGSRWMRAAAFPVAFLVFMAPMPDAMVDWCEKASMHASAEAAAIFFSLTGTPVVRSGTVFELPRITLQVAQECSGIRSSWVLFLTSLIASRVFLQTKWTKLLFVAFVIPLGIVRNGFRILVIGLLCVHVGPHMIHSPIHQRGGPVFFVLSLIPLTLVLWWLRAREQRANLSR